MTTLLEICEVLLILFGLTYAFATTLLLVLSLQETTWLARAQKPVQTARLEAGRYPTVSLVVPAYNEEMLIVQSVTSLLALDYPGVEVVVVDDGSTDRTLANLEEAFDLVPLPLQPAKHPLETATFRGVFISRGNPALRVVHKENGGRSD